MKSIVFLVVMACGILGVGCREIKEKTAEELLESPVMEDKIYATILNDSVLFLKFIDKMLLDEKSKKMFSNNSGIVKTVCMSEKMESLMSSDQQVIEMFSNRLIKRMVADSFVCDHTCTRIMENQYLKKYFRERGIGK